MSDNVKIDIPEEAKEDEYELTAEEAEALLQLDIRKEYFDIARHLDMHHAFFYQIWEMGVPRLTFAIKTAAVRFDKNGHKLEFLFNPAFWKSCSQYKKIFVICHEFLHVLLNHGIRIKDCEVDLFANYAGDIVINHLLIDKFGFEREKIEGWENYCWIDTLFAHLDNVLPNKSLEYYYGILDQNCIVIDQQAYMDMLKKQNDGGGKGGGKGNSSKSKEKITSKTVDDHSGLSSTEEPNLQKEIKDKIDKGLNDEEKEDLANKLNSEEGESAAAIEKDKHNNLRAGTLAGNLIYYANIRNQVKKKRKWETVIQKWSRKFKKGDCEVEQWARNSRRFSFLGENLMLPSEHEDEMKEESMIDVFFLLDTSGSCSHLADRFWTAARSLPEDRFIIHLHCFDTKVYEVDMKVGKLYGFGGTSFASIENYIQEKKRKEEIKTYPQAVFVITDGYGDSFTPERPENWYFFLSENYLEKIPEKANIFMLKDFE